MYVFEKSEKLLKRKAIIMFMATITLRVEVEEALIEAKIPRKEWAKYVNQVTFERLKKEKEEKMTIS
jgi:hypothetical protein